MHGSFTLYVRLVTSTVSGARTRREPEVSVLTPKRLRSTSSKANCCLGGIRSSELERDAPDMGRNVATTVTVSASEVFRRRTSVWKNAPFLPVTRATAGMILSARAAGEARMIRAATRARMKTPSPPFDAEARPRFQRGGNRARPSVITSCRVNRASEGASGEELLVARLKEGDDGCFALLVRRHGGSLLAKARRFLRNEEDARDAVQDAFLRAHQAIAGFEGGSSLSTWLHRILINGCLMKLRSRRRKPEEPIETSLPRFLEDGHRRAPDPAWPEDDAYSALERRETRAFVRELIDELPDSYRAVLILRDIEERDTAEAAARLELTENAVKIRLHRARQALREMLAPRLSRKP